MEQTPDIMIPAWINGELTPVEKLDAHLRGLRHKAVSIFLMDGDKILLQQRAMGKYHTPGLWANTVCTHPNWGEDPDQCAYRRLNDELGIKRAELRQVGQVEYRADVGGGLIEHEVVDLFLGQFDGKMSPNPDEVMDTAWMSIETLKQELKITPEKYTPWLKIYMSEHLDLITNAIA